MALVQRRRFRAQKRNLILAIGAMKKEYSGKLLLRLPKSLHKALAEEAEKEGVSLNQLIMCKLGVLLRKATKDK